jgi:hypothetical protein
MRRRERWAIVALPFMGALGIGHADDRPRSGAKRVTPPPPREGKIVYFCCEGCSRYFAANRERVLGSRGLPL